MKWIGWNNDLVFSRHFQFFTSYKLEIKINFLENCIKNVDIDMNKNLNLNAFNFGFVWAFIWNFNLVLSTVFKTINPIINKHRKRSNKPVRYISLPFWDSCPLGSCLAGLLFGWRDTFSVQPPWMSCMTCISKII